MDESEGIGEATGDKSSGVSLFSLANVSFLIFYAENISLRFTLLEQQN